MIDGWRGGRFSFDAEDLDHVTVVEASISKLNKRPTVARKRKSCPDGSIPRGFGVFCWFKNLRLRSPKIMGGHQDACMAPLVGHHGVFFFEQQRSSNVLQSAYRWRSFSIPASLKSVRGRFQLSRAIGLCHCDGIGHRASL